MPPSVASAPGSIGTFDAAVAFGARRLGASGSMAVTYMLLLRFVPGTESDPDGDNKPARRALILGVLAAVTILVFWTGLPFALGVPALALGGVSLVLTRRALRLQPAPVAV